MRTEKKIEKSVAFLLLEVISPKTNSKKAISSEP